MPSVDYKALYEQSQKELEEVKKERDIYKGLHKITRCKKIGFMNMKASKDYEKFKEENEGLKLAIHKGLEAQIEDEEEIKKLKEENKELKETIECHTAELMYADLKGPVVEDYRDFNKFLKNRYSSEDYQKLYDNLQIEECLCSDDSESEDEE